MVRLDDLKKDAIVRGIAPGGAVKIVSIDPIGEHAVTVYYLDGDGPVAEQMLFRSDEARLDLVVEGRPWSFDGDGADFKLAAEAYRIQLAHLFDPLMAVHTSTVVPLPHQITAVYESMLPRQPFKQEPDFGVTSINFNLDELLSQEELPAR